MPSFVSSDAAEHCSGPALDGGRQGWFNANAQACKKRAL
jgi:hypothetical protein